MPAFFGLSYSKIGSISHVDLDSAVGNYFFNIDEDDSADLMAPLIGRLLAKRHASGQFVSHERLREALSLCYSDRTIDHDFDEIIDYMVRTGMVEMEMKLKEDKSGSEKLYLATPQLISMWRALSKSSIFVEFFRDDTFLEHKRLFYLNGGRLCGTSHLAGVEKFLAAAEFIEEICRAEGRIHKHVGKERIYEFKKLFGSVTITRILAKGLRNSVKRYYMASPDSVFYKKQVPSNLKARLDELFRYVKANLMLE